MSTSQKLTLKIEFEGEVRRLRGWPEHHAEPSIEGLRSAISSLFDLSPAQLDVLAIKYCDDEGDLCTLVEASLLDALTFAAERGVLRLTAACGQPIPTLSVEATTVCTIEPAALQDLSQSAGFAQAYPVAEVTEEQTEATPQCSTTQAEPCSRSPSSVAGHFEEVRRNAAEHLSEARRVATDRLEHARPHVANEFARFKQQVVDDFVSTSTDMKDAFGRDEVQALGAVRTVVGTAAGVLAAARLSPIRATRLAAKSVAAVVGREIPSADTDDERESVAAGSDPCAMSDFQHLKHQVKNDFQSSRRDVTIAFSCIIEGAESTTPSDALSSGSADQTAAANEPDGLQSQQQPQQSLKTTLPAVISTVVGGGAAACLLPVRVARFAVANLANAVRTGIAITPRDGQRESAQSAHPEQPESTPQLEESTQPEQPEPSLQLAADEVVEAAA